MSKNAFIRAYQDSPLFAVLRAQHFHIKQATINDWELEARVIAARQVC